MAYDKFTTLRNIISFLQPTNRAAQQIAFHIAVINSHNAESRDHKGTIVPNRQFACLIMLLLYLP